MRRRSDSDMVPGQDSFLDVVANLVGILLILIMVVGVQTRAALVEAKHEEKPPEGPALTRIAELQSTADDIERDVNETAVQLNRHDVEIAYRRKERDKLLVLVTAAEQAVEAEKGKLTSAERDHIDNQRQLADLERQLEELRVARDAAENATGATSIIEHLPTPMAKTVFGTELHVRLAQGRLTVIPWDELVGKLKDEAQQQLWKLKDTPSITETAGPIGGFRIRYILRQADYPVETKVGPIMQRRIELERFELLPVSDDLGEPIERALDEGSQFMAHVGNVDPRQTTITVWVYPDGFDQFRWLKSQLYKRGLLTAARPMPEGRLIGGSPHGTRSAAQ